MIYNLHIEAHWGYRPRISIRRAPRSGDRVTDGGVPGTLVLCQHCQEGFFHHPDPPKGGQQRHPTATRPPKLHSEDGEYWLYPDPS